MKAFKITGIILGIALLLMFGITLSIDGIVKNGIEENGRALLGTDVTVEDVDISLFDGAGTIEGFEVSNPDGYTDKNAIRIQKASLQVDIGSLFSDQVIVKELRVDEPELYFEQKELSANLKELNDHLNSGEPSDSEKSLVIEHLLIEEGLVKVRTDIERERTAQAEFDRFELNGIGQGGSNTVQESVKQMMEPLLEQAIAEAATSGVLEQLKNKALDLIDG